MSTLSTKHFSALIQLVFNHSPQAVLAIDEARVSYANRAAIDLLGINPTGFPLINYVDATFATLAKEAHADSLPKTRRVKFFDHYYDILPLHFHETLLMFLYAPDAMYSKTDLFKDTLSLLKALTKSAKKAFDENETPALKTALFQNSLAVETLEYACNVSLVAYDFISLFEYAMSSFSDLAERGFLKCSVVRTMPAPAVAVDCRLMHAALVGTVFDLLRLTKTQDVLAISCSYSKTEVTLTFSCEKTKFPRELEDILLGSSDDSAINDLQKHGTYFLLSKRIFAIHKAKPQLMNSDTGFTLTLSFPCALQPHTLYMERALRSDFPTPFSLSRKEINEFFSDTEKA